MPRTTRSAIRLGVLTATCAAGLLLAGPAVAVEATGAVPSPVLNTPCLVEVELPPPYTCDPATTLVTLLPGQTEPATLIPEPTPRATTVSPSPTASQQATRTPTPAAGRTLTTPPVAPAPAAGPGMSAGLAPALPAAPSNLIGQRVGPAPLSGAPAAPLPLTALPPVQALSAVQDPLLAVGDAAAAGGGSPLSAMSGSALPGLLVVLATAAVAAVGVGNVRAWQLRQLPVRRRR